ncbi:MAG: oligosaccharyltransferase complex subunit epsilon [Chrysothrix sp. TS-e1954]|nr:MAG: oligosaccharyltransferase complex subunit epsilon [Chrysothrix sp. TS-e1954]
MPPKRTVTPTAAPPPPSSPPAVSPSNDANTAKPSTAVSSKPPRDSKTNTPSKPVTSSKASTPSKNTRSSGSKSSSGKTSEPQSRLQEAWRIGEEVWDRYTNETPVRVLMIDSFMGFLVVVAVIQFVYCLLITAYPFNAFLSGFSACVGQFVLTASLRMQTNPENRKAFEGQQEGVAVGTGEKISDERAFADFVFGSLVLHFFCVNFVN